MSASQIICKFSSPKIFRNSSSLSWSNLIQCSRLSSSSWLHQTSSSSSLSLSFVFVTGSLVECFTLLSTSFKQFCNVNDNICISSWSEFSLLGLWFSDVIFVYIGCVEDWMSVLFWFSSDKLRVSLRDSVKVISGTSSIVCNSGLDTVRRS